MGHLLRYLFEPGFFSSGPVHDALAVGAIVAITSAVVGVFTVTRGQSFAGHSLADIATTGGSGAFLIGVNQFWGFLAFGAGAAAFMEMIGVQRRRGRDVATGVVLGAALGLAALFLYLSTQESSTTGASFTILFGSIFVLTSSTIPALIVSALLALATVAVLARVLLLSALSPDIAAARGVPVRAVGAAYLMALAISVALSAVIIGAILSTALLVGRPRPRCASRRDRSGRRRWRRASACWPPGSASCSPTTATTGPPRGAAGRSASSWSP